jgi:hypothetical protein
MMNHSILRYPVCRRVADAWNSRSRFVSDLNGAPFDLDNFELSFKRRSLGHFALWTSIQCWNENGNCVFDMPSVFTP